MSSTREVAERIVMDNTDSTGYIYPARMAAAISAALQHREQEVREEERERAAGIARTHNEGHGDAFCNCGLSIAGEIMSL
jgi:hypothetical protein